MPHRYTIPSLNSSFFAIAALLLFSGIPAGCGPSVDDTMIGGGGPGGSDTAADFPAGPTSDGTVPSSTLPGLADSFSSAMSSATGGPCMSEPSLEAMYPLNFSPPAFSWNAPTTQNIFELRLHIDNQVNDLVLYTSSSSFNLPSTMWSGVVQHSAGRDVRITLRGGQLQGSKLVGSVYTGASGVVHIAPVSAPGSIVYWTTSGGSALKGFHIGDVRPMTVLTPAAMRTAQPGDDTQCVGCHTSSPDGLLAFMGRSPMANNYPFSIDARLIDGTSARPINTTVSDNALVNMQRSLQFMPTFSPAHYSPTDSILITVGGNLTKTAFGPFNLIWTDLHATSGGTGLVNRQGDSNWADSPSFSKDGTLIAYSSTNDIAIDQSPTVNDIYTVPWNVGAGGTASPLLGASDPNWNEYYPAYSPYDTFVAFNRGPVNGVVYNSPNSEVFIVPAQGGQATRVRANDAPACLGTPSPGLTNSYPRWAPEAVPYNGKNYYWMVFSSTRRIDPVSGFALPQLYLSVIVTNTSSGTETLEQTYPAIYLPEQVSSESNHTPAWDVFQIPGAG